MQYTVFARFTAKVGMADQLKQLILDQVEPTRAEPGNLNYDIHVTNADPNTFVLYENWKSKDDLDAHFKTQHMVDFSARVNEIIAAPMDFQSATMISRSETIEG